jgi:heme/copper-type cytochrome/quinol oxidase subunit 4
MTDAQHSDRPYVMIWGALMGALVISRFMHLRDEPTWIRTVFFGAISVLVILWVGLLWDIARAFS